MFFRIKKDTATPKLKKVIDSLTHKSAFFKVWGNAVAKDAQRNARAYSKGGRFWHAIAEATRLRDVSDRGATISNDHVAGAHKHFGGTIKPKNGKYLAIPGEDNPNKQLWPSEYPDGELSFLRLNGKALLLDATTDALMFVLVRQVTQSPQPWWPSTADALKIGSDNAEQWLDKLTGAT